MSPRKMSTDRILNHLVRRITNIRIIRLIDVDMTRKGRSPTKIRMDKFRKDKDFTVPKANVIGNPRIRIAQEL